MREWGADHGYDAPGFPLGPVEALARTRKVWSRAYLIADGRGALADFYDGKRADPPPLTEWRADMPPTTAEPAS
jgi:hypothetical protein